MRNQFVIGLSLAVFICGGCSKNNLSDRDTRLNQIRNNADKKRKELQLVEGSYKGMLQVSDPNIGYTILLKLEIVDFPVPVEGQVDPVQTPVLAGFMRLFADDSDDGKNAIPMGIESSEFDAGTGILNLVLNSQAYGAINISAQKNESELKGTWIAKLGASGTLSVSKQ